MEQPIESISRALRCENGDTIAATFSKLAASVQLLAQAAEHAGATTCGDEVGSVEFLAGNIHAGSVRIADALQEIAASLYQIAEKM